MQAEVKDILDEILLRAQAEKRPLITAQEIELWSAPFGWDCLFNSLAILIAQMFHAEDMSYDHGDWIMNELFGLVLRTPIEENELPEPFFSIFLAFDDGEHHHLKDRSDNPIVDYTIPQIGDILQSLPE